MPGQAQRANGSLVSNHTKFGARRRLVESTTLRPLYPRGKTRYPFYRRGWVGLGGGLDMQICHLASRYLEDICWLYTHATRALVQMETAGCSPTVQFTPRQKLS